MATAQGTKPPSGIETAYMSVRLTFRTLLMSAALLGVPHAHAQGPSAPPAKSAPQPDSAIVAVVNGDVISRGDVDNRRRLFAISTGLPVTNDVLDRLAGQVTRQLIDERLRLQEAQRRHIVVQDREIAAAIGEVEGRNNMPPGTLSRQLAASGVELRTLIDQFRVQIAWGRVLRQLVAQQGEPSDADITDQENQIKAQVGQPEYRIGEIFTPVANPSQDAEARRFVDTVIGQLRAGAPFSVIAAQFSQSQTALQGGDLGWLQSNQLDPAVLRVVREMPPGAISNPIKVAGGYSIVTLRAKREVGRDPATILKIRQAWLPFTQRLNPAAPTPQQISQLEAAKKISASVKSCDAMEAANTAQGNVRPTDPGEIRLESVGNPQMRQLLTGLTLGQATPPLPNEDGISVVILCSREQKNLGVPSRAELVEKIINERIELASRQLMRDLQRRAVIDQRA
jgi:peptidyl-prolyl cis-trans isomerase SurA